MDVVKSFLATEVLTSILMLGSIALVVRSYMSYAKDASELGPKLTKIQAQLVKMRNNVEPKRQVVSDLTLVIQPIKEQADRFSHYYGQLRSIEMEAEKLAVANAESEEADKRRRLQRKRMGLKANEGNGGEEQEE